MTPRLHRLLVASESEDSFHLIRDHLSSMPLGGQAIRPKFCLPSQLDDMVREFEADAALVIQAQFQEEMIPAVRRWKAARPDLQVLFLFTQQPNTRALVDLMRAGAFDVLEADGQNVSSALLRDVLSNLARRVEEVHTGSFERLQARQNLADVGLIGETIEMQNLFVQVMHAARLTCPVLIWGEPGSGKRVAAHAIHALSPLGAKPIVTVDCGSLSPPLLDVALFGPATATRSPGMGHGSLLDAARRGSLLLHEVGETPYGIQLEFLRLLEVAEAEGPSALEVRLLSTTSRRMDALVERRIFRADLGYRLNVFPLHIPPLRKRVDDIPLLARYFLSRHDRDNRAFLLNEDAAAALCRYSWPGNVRELKAALEQAIANSVDDMIVEAHLPPHVTATRRDGRTTADTFSSSELNLARLEEQAILRALHISGFDKAKTARLLGIGKTTMYRKLKEISARSRLGRSGP